MNSIGIACYSIKIREKRTNDYLPFGELEGGKSFYDFVRGYLDKLKKEHVVNEEDQLVLRAARSVHEEDITAGLLYSGDYGYEAAGFNVKTKKTSYRRTAEDAEVIPFYYQFVLPQQSNKGLMILQRHGHRGLLTALSTDLRAEFASQYDGYVLEIGRLVPAEVLKQLIEGDYIGIKVSTYTVPDDIADKFRYLGNLRQDGHLTITYKAKRSQALVEPDWLKAIRKNGAKLVELPDELKEMDAKVSIIVEYGGKQRDVNLNNLSAIAPYIDATNDLEIKKNGHPKFDSIHTYCNDLRTTLLADLGIGDAV
jgi:hypothetical protein